MKTLHKIILGTTVLAIQTAAFAFPMLSENTYNGTPVMTFNVITPHAKKISLDKGQIWAGTSTRAPCSDLMVIHEANGEAGYAKNGSFNIGSKAIVDMVGTNVTCIRDDVTYNGKNYSSGNIQLTWDAFNGKYTKASPSLITIDFTK